MTRIGDEALGGHVSGLGPSAHSVQPLPGPDSRTVPYRWQAIGPRGVMEGLEPSYDEAWKAAHAAPVGRLSTDEDPTMPEYTPLWRRYPTRLVKRGDGRWEVLDVSGDPHLGEGGR